MADLKQRHTVPVQQEEERLHARPEGLDPAGRQAELSLKLEGPVAVQSSLAGQQVGRREDAWGVAPGENRREIGGRSAGRDQPLHFSVRGVDQPADGRLAQAGTLLRLRGVGQVGGGKDAGAEREGGGAQYVVVPGDHDLRRGAPQVDERPFALDGMAARRSKKAELRLMLGRDDMNWDADDLARLADESRPVGGLPDRLGGAGDEPLIPVRLRLGPNLAYGAEGDAGPTADRPAPGDLRTELGHLDVVGHFLKAASDGVGDQAVDGVGPDAALGKAQRAATLDTRRV